MQLDQGYLSTGEKIVIKDVTPGYFEIDSNQVSQQCTLLAPSSGMKIKSCIVNRVSASIEFEVQSGQSTFLQVRVDKFRNPPSVNSFAFTLVRQSVSGQNVEQKAMFVDNLQPLIMQDAELTPLQKQIGSKNGVLKFDMTIASKIPVGGIIQVTMPTWNPLAYKNQREAMISVEQPDCSGITTLPSSLTCEFDEQRHLLRVGPLTSAVSLGAQLSFSVSQVRNPYNSKTKSGFVISIMDKDGYLIESSKELSFNVNQPANFKSLQVNPMNGSVSGQTIYQLSYNLDLPMDPLCKIIISAPSKVFNLKATVSRVSAFTSFRNSDLKINEDTNSIILEGCKGGYISSTLNFDTIAMNYMVNPSHIRDTAPFTVKMYALDEQGYEYIVAEDNSKAYVRASFLQPGSFYDLQVNSSNHVVQTKSEFYSIQFKSTNAIPSTGRGGHIVVTFPNDIKLTFGSCRLQEPLINVRSKPTSCIVRDNQLQITGISAKEIPPHTQVKFTVLKELLNPIASGNAGQFKIESFFLDPSDETQYLIAEMQTSINDKIYEIIPGTFKYVEPPKVSTSVTFNKDTIYTIVIQLQHKQPAGTILVINLPKQITIDSVQQLETSSTFAIGTNGSPQKPTIKKIDVTSGMIEMTGIFEYDFVPGVKSTSLLKLEIAGLQNPRSLAETDSFRITSKLPSGNFIDQIEEQLTVKMLKPGELLSFIVKPDSVLNGDITIYNFNVITNAPLYDRDRLEFSFPSDIDFAQSTTCIAKSANLKSVTCLKKDLSFSAILLFSSEGKMVEKNSLIEFQVTQVINPFSLKPSQPFTGIQTISELNEGISEYLLQQVQVTMVTPGDITSAVLKSTSDQPSARVVITLNLLTINQIPSNGAFVIRYPDSVKGDNELKDCSVSFGSNKYRRSCAINHDTQTITMKGGLPGTIPAGTNMTIVLGEFKNPAGVEDRSLVVRTYFDQNAEYLIDQVTTGLLIEVKCNSPCKNCPSRNQPDSCTECYRDGSSDFKFLHPEQKCLKQCPDGYFGNEDDKCQPCLSNCKTCSGAFACDSCDTREISTHKFYFDQKCYPVCPKGTYTDRGSGQCIPCSSPCLECTGPDNGQCLSCSQSDGNKMIYFQSKFCQEQCSTGFTPNDSFECIKCQGCLTCETIPTKCTSCFSKFFKFGHSCLNKCPNGFTDDIVTQTCVDCKPKCKQCRGADPKTQICEICQKGFVVYNGTCTAECPEGMRADVMTKTFCEKDGPMSVAEQLFGIPPCQGQPGQINKTTVLVYFPMSFFLLVVIGLVLFSYFYYRKTTDFLGLLNCAMAPVETLALWIQLIQAFSVEKGYYFDCVLSFETGSVRSNYPIVCWISLLCLTGLYTMNGYNIYTLLKSEKLSYDPLFEAWRRKYNKTSYKLVLILQSVFNFKFTTLWVSGWLGRKRYIALFSKTSGMKVWDRLVAHLGIASLICFNLPILITNFAATFFYGWSEQLQIILADVMIVLTVSMIVEILYLRQEQKRHTSPEPEPLKVSAICNEDDDSLETQKEEEPEPIEEEPAIETAREEPQKSVYSQPPTRSALYSLPQTAQIMDEPQLFNVNDVLGEFDRKPDTAIVEIIHDEYSGNLVDKFGRIVNENGYLINEEGSIVNQMQIEVVPRKDQGAGNELPPTLLFNSFNFNAHDILGNFAPDKKGLPPRFDLNGHKLNKFGYLIDEFGNIQTRNGRRMMEKFYLTRDQNLPNLLNYHAVEFRLQDVIGKMIRDDINGEAVLKYQKATGQYWDRDARQVNKRGYMVDREGNVIDKAHKNRVVFRRTELQQDGEIPKIFTFTKFDPRLVLGRFERNARGKPKLKRGGSGVPFNLRKDKDNRLVNRLGYLCDKFGHIVDKNQNKVFDKKILQQGLELPEVLRRNILTSLPVVEDSLSDLMNEVDPDEEHDGLDSGNETMNVNEEGLEETLDDLADNQYLDQDHNIGDNNMNDSARNDMSATHLLNRTGDPDHVDTAQRAMTSDNSVPWEDLLFEHRQIQHQHQHPLSNEKDQFLNKLRELHHGHAFGYIGQGLMDKPKLTEMMAGALFKKIKLRDQNQVDQPGSPRRGQNSSSGSPAKIIPMLSNGIMQNYMNKSGSKNSPRIQAMSASPFKRSTNNISPSKRILNTDSNWHTKIDPSKSPRLQDSKLKFKTVKRKTSDSPSNMGSKAMIKPKPVPFTAGGPMPSGKNSILMNKSPASVLEEESMMPGSMQDQIESHPPKFNQSLHNTMQGGAHGHIDSRTKDLRTAPAIQNGIDKQARQKRPPGNVSPIIERQFSKNSAFQGGNNLTVQQKVANLDPETLAYLQEQILNEVGIMGSPRGEHLKSKSPLNFKNYNTTQTADPDISQNQERLLSQGDQLEGSLERSSNFSAKKGIVKGRVNKKRLKKLEESYLTQIAKQTIQQSSDKKQSSLKKALRQGNDLQQNRGRLHSEMGMHKTQQQIHSRPGQAGNGGGNNLNGVPSGEEWGFNQGGPPTEQSRHAAAFTTHQRVDSRSIGMEVLGVRNDTHSGFRTLVEPDLREISEHEPDQAWGGNMSNAKYESMKGAQNEQHKNTNLGTQHSIGEDKNEDDLKGSGAESSIVHGGQAPFSRSLKNQQH